MRAQLVSRPPTATPHINAIALSIERRDGDDLISTTTYPALGERTAALLLDIAPSSSLPVTLSAAHCCGWPVCAVKPVGYER